MCFLHYSDFKHQYFGLVVVYHPGSIRNRYLFIFDPDFGLYPAGSIRNFRMIIRPSCNGDEVRKHALYEKSSESSSSRGLPRFHLGFLSGIFSEIIMQIQRVRESIVLMEGSVVVRADQYSSHCYENMRQDIVYCLIYDII